MQRMRTHVTAMLMLAVLSALVLAPMHTRAEGDADGQNIVTIDGDTYLTSVDKDGNTVLAPIDSTGAYARQQVIVYPAGLTDTYGVNLINYRSTNDVPDSPAEITANMAYYTHYIAQTRLKVVRVPAHAFGATDLQALYNAGARVFYVGVDECGQIDGNGHTLASRIRAQFVDGGRTTIAGEKQSIFDWVKSKESLGRYHKASKPNGIIVYLEVNNEPNHPVNCPGWNSAKSTSYYQQLLFAYSDLAINGAAPNHNIGYFTGSTFVRSTLTSSVMDWIYAHPQTFANDSASEVAFDGFFGHNRVLQGFTSVSVPAHAQDGHSYGPVTRTMGYKGVAYHAYDDSDPACRPDWSQNARIARADQLVASPNVRTVHLNEANVNIACGDGTRSFAFKDLMNYYYPQRAKVPWVTFFFVDNRGDSRWPLQRILIQTSCYMIRSGYVPSTGNCA